jgi:hypothetical protein
MQLTFAELQFLLSLSADESELDVMHLLEEPDRDVDAVAAAGLASLVARQLCTADDHDDGSDGSDGDHDLVVSLTPSLLTVTNGLCGAVTSVRITTVTAQRTTFWLLLVGSERLVLTPASAGVYHVEPISSTADLRQQVVAVVRSALDDEPAAGVALARRGRWDALSFRTNAELGGVDAPPAVRLAAIDELVDAVFVDHHPSRG